MPFLVRRTFSGRVGLEGTQIQEAFDCRRDSRSAGLVSGRGLLKVGVSAPAAAFCGAQPNFWHAPGMAGGMAGSTHRLQEAEGSANA